MYKVIFLALICLLSGVLLLSSCFQIMPDTPPAPAAQQPTIPTILNSYPSTPTNTTTPTPTTTTTSSTAAIPAPSDDGWGEWGPLKWPAEFKTTSGAYLDFAKKEELTVDGKPAIIYYLIAAGLSKDKIYHLWFKSLANTTPKELIPEAKIGDSGYVIKGENRFQLGVQAPAKGEAMEFALMTEDKTGGVLGKIIPYPIESYQGPYRLWVELRSKKGDLFSIYGEGFLSNEEVTFTSISENEKASGKVKADDKGRLNITTLPAVSGKETGVATLTVNGKNGEISISYQWGMEATKSGTLTPSPTPTPQISTTSPTPVKKPLPPLDAFMKGILFFDWNPFYPPAPSPGNPPRPPRGLFAPPEADQSLRNLAATGANWVGIQVVAGQETIASTSLFRNSPATATDSELHRIVDMAHRLGMRVMLRTGVGLSRDPNHFSGHIGTAFTTEAQWQEWFTSYRDYVNDYAALSEETGIDMLCIGVEMGGTTHREEDWRRIIKEVRESYKGFITYSSLNTAPWGFPHSEENRIKWWDAVDYIGVSAYYGLTDRNDPTVAEIKAVWKDKWHIGLLENLTKRFNKPIIFTEIGYESKDGNNRLPASGARTGPVDLQEQADCYQAVLEVMSQKPWMRGLFFFQWYIQLSKGGPNDNGFSPYGKPAEEVLKKFYLEK